MIKRKRAREQALQIMYLLEYTESSLNEVRGLFEHHFESKNLDDVFLSELLEGTSQHLRELDEMIKKHLINWKFYRLPRVDRSILRLGAYELVFCKDVPASVTLDEAVELGKKYGDQKTGSFVNGVLDRIAHEYANAK